MGTGEEVPFLARLFDLETVGGNAGVTPHLLVALSDFVRQYLPLQVFPKHDLADFEPDGAEEFIRT